MGVVRIYTNVLGYNDKVFYDMIKSSCEIYNDYSYEQFHRCASGLYIYTDNSNSTLLGIIGCRMVDKSELGLSDLLYHCDEDNVYTIDFLHVLGTTGIEGDKHTAYTIAYQLLHECMADKNDRPTFCIIKSKPDMVPSIHNSLVNNSFKLKYDSDIMEGVWVYSRYPTFRIDDPKPDYYCGVCGSSNVNKSVMATTVDSNGHIVNKDVLICDDCGSISIVP